MADSFTIVCDSLNSIYNQISTISRTENLITQNNEYNLLKNLISDFISPINDLLTYFKNQTTRIIPPYLLQNIKDIQQALDDAQDLLREYVDNPKKNNYYSKFIEKSKAITTCKDNLLLSLQRLSVETLYGHSQALASISNSLNAIHCDLSNNDKNVKKINRK